MRTHSLFVYILVVFLLSSGSISGKTSSSTDSVVTEYGYPSYPGSEEELKDFIMSRLDFSKYPHETNYEYTANCWIDTLGKVKQVIMNYRNENSEWEDEIATVLYAMPDWQFPAGTIKDSALVAIPLLFIPINKTIDPDEEYESNEIFKLQIHYPEFPGGFSDLECFFTKSLKRLKIEEKDRLMGRLLMPK